MLRTLTVWLLQAIVAWITGFGVIMSVPVGGGGRELIAFALVTGFAIWAVGSGIALFFDGRPRALWQSLAASLLGTFFGAGILMIPNIAWGFQGLLLPIIGGVAAYHYVSAAGRS